MPLFKVLRLSHGKKTHGKVSLFPALSGESRRELNVNTIKVAA